MANTKQEVKAATMVNLPKGWKRVYSDPFEWFLVSPNGDSVTDENEIRNILKEA